MYTIQQCKEDMIKVWSELARIGDYFKPLWTATFANNCPCCHYAMGYTVVSCNRCPIPEWAAQADFHATPCEAPGEDYERWCEADGDLDRQYWANKILIKAHMIRSK